MDWTRISSAVLDEVRGWQAHQLDAIYPVLYLDVLQVKVKSQRREVNKAIYLAFGVNLQVRGTSSNHSFVKRPAHAIEFMTLEPCKWPPQQDVGSSGGC